MKRNKTIIVIDLIVFLINDILGWFIFILLTDTGFNSEYQLFTISYQTNLIIAIVHIASSIIVSVLFFTKERTRFKIQIKKDLLIYNVIMTIFPYLMFGLYVYYQKNLAV